MESYKLVHVAYIFVGVSTFFKTVFPKYEKNEHNCHEKDLVYINGMVVKLSDILNIMNLVRERLKEI